MFVRQPGRNAEEKKRCRGRPLGVTRKGSDPRNLSERIAGHSTEAVRPSSFAGKIAKFAEKVRRRGRRLDPHRRGRRCFRRVRGRVFQRGIARKIMQLGAKVGGQGGVANSTATPGETITDRSDGDHVPRVQSHQIQVTMVKPP